MAGGLGTRLRSVVADRPKAMAEVCGRPFLGYVVDYLQRQGIDRIVLALGYGSEAIVEWVETEAPKNVEFVYSIEQEPLGTGGAIKQALECVRADRAVVMNGDTLFEVDLSALEAGHTSDLTLALKPMRNFERYGTVELNLEGRVVRFNEKRWCAEGLINGGVYLIEKKNSLFEGLSTKFSFETAVLEPQSAQGVLGGVVSNGYFIDIGIPEDFSKAQIDFSTTLMLDRDGVINVHRPDDYVKSVVEFEFCHRALEALALLAKKFERIVVVTNQRGVGRGLMSQSDLCAVHEYMLAQVAQAGGRIDRIYCSTATDAADPRRKPNVGMALEAKNDFPDIEFHRTVMVGDSAGDMEFGRRIGAATVHIGKEVASLYEFAIQCKQ